MDISLEEMQLRSLCDSFSASAHTQLAIDTADLGLNGIGGDDQHLGHLRVGLPGYQKAQHPLLLGREGLNGRLWISFLQCAWQGLARC